jgi:catechol O-methyltransferase
MIKLAGLEDFVQITQGTSSDTLNKLKDEGNVEQIDDLFLDHINQYYLSDWKPCEDLGFFHKGSPSFQIIWIGRIRPRRSSM